jgi:putative glycosyltransferase (TIGR04372 family)
MRIPFPTDLNEQQWQCIRAEVFHGDNTADELRAVIDALSYRERSVLPWDLLPPGFPDAIELRCYSELWRNDGTWQVIRRLVEQPPLGGGRLRRLKRALGKRLRSLPGGKLILVPGRWGLRILKKVRSWRPRARMGNYQRAVVAADRLFKDRQYAAARDNYAIYLSVASDDALVWLRYCWACEGANSFEEAGIGAWMLLVLTGDDYRVAALAILNRTMLHRRDIDRAMGCLFCRKWIERFPGDPHGYVRIERPTENAAGMEIFADCLASTGEDVINLFGDFDTGLDLYRRKAAIQHDYISRFGIVPKRELFLSADWVRNIGHMAYLDFFVKMNRLGWRSDERLVLLAPPSATANAWYLKYWQTYYEIVSDAHLASVYGHFANVLGDRVSSRLELPSGVETYFCEGMGTIQEAWENDTRGPLLDLTVADRDFGREQLRRMGLPDNAWFVCLHVRSAGYHREWQNPHQAHRNADIRSYLPAIEEIVGRGGWVIRMGDRTMPSLPRMPQTIDYARSDFKSQRLDIILCGSCRFFAGVASGLSHIPTTFGIPCVMTNWVSNAFPVYSRNDRFLPKLARSNRNGRLLTFPEWLAPEVRRWCYAGSSLRENGIRVVDNSAEELREIVAEMLDLLEGRDRETPEDRARRSAFSALARQSGLMGFSQIGRDFLRRHADLLPLDATSQFCEASSRAA